MKNVNVKYNLNQTAPQHKPKHIKNCWIRTCEFFSRIWFKCLVYSKRIKRLVYSKGIKRLVYSKGIKRLVYSKGIKFQGDQTSSIFQGDQMSSIFKGNRIRENQKPNTKELWGKLLLDLSKSDRVNSFNKGNTLLLMLLINPNYKETDKKETWPRNAENNQQAFLCANLKWRHYD